ncbi:MAG: phosphoenolpyruvate synthase [Lachnospiraceae bacterium]|nr:phosphoenolpyruvate synthase [Lachnospiraceae bacterium]
MIVTEENYKNFNMGAKAENLFVMQKNGVNIPPFFCFFKEDTQEATEYAAKFFDSSERIALRSSASAEDGKTTSFAGQFRTCLHLSPEELPKAAQQVCTVPKNAGFIEYCKMYCINPSEIRICAIAQKMVDAELSGVLFTANPQGILNESVVVIGRGTGENVVADRTDTTAYYCNRPEGLYYSEQSGDSPLLSEKLLMELLAQGEKIKEIFRWGEDTGTEWDIEFAIKDNEIYILQARPITTLGPTVRPIILDNSNIVESYPGITLPLTQSFIREAYYHVFRRVVLRLTHEPDTVAKLEDILHNMVDTVNGRVYYRISNWYDVILLLPFSRKIIPIWQEMLGVNNKTVTSHADRKTGFVTHAKVALSFVRLMVACPRLMEQLNRDFKNMIEDFETVDLNQADNAEILAHYKNMLENVTEKWDLTLVNDMYAFLYTGLLKSRLKARKVPDAEAFANRCISGLNGIESMKPVNALTDMADMAVKQGALAQLREIHSCTDYTEYISGGGILAEKMKDYIQRYGDRNAEELKLESSTFRTNPELLAQKIVQYAEQGITVSEPEDANAPRLKGLCRIFAKKAALGIKNREKSRLNRSRLYGMMRAMMLKVGENLTEAGSLDRQADIFYLTYEEVEQAVTDDKNLRELVAERKELYRQYEKLPAYTRLIFADKVFNKNPKKVGGMQAAVSANRLEGIPCSGGKAKGEVLLIENPCLQTDTARKILVAKMTDPGWVFLLAGAAGIVAEKGSLLSHTAIISRELKKPAVVGVEGVTRLLQNGDLVEIDGGTGQINVVSRARDRQ